MAQDDVSPPLHVQAAFVDDLKSVLAQVQKLLLQKNASYGDSALEPIRILSRADAQEGIKVRIDDKLSRLARGHGDQEDTILDLLGYLVMLRIAQRRAKQAP